jgi:hypothetical protein
MMELVEVRAGRVAQGPDLTDGCMLELEGMLPS